MNMSVYSTLHSFLKLAPVKSVLLLLGSLVAGVLQSLSILSLVPLMLHFGAYSADDKSNPLIIFYLDNLGSVIGDSLPLILFFIVLFVLLSSTLNYFIKLHAVIVSAKIQRQLRNQVLNANLSSKWSYFSGKKTGEVVNSVITEAGYAITGYQHSINMLSSLIQGIAIIFSSFFISPYIFLASLVSGLTIVVLFIKWSERARVIGVESDVLLKSITSRITDGIHGIKSLKAMGIDRFLIPLLEKETLGLEDKQIKLFSVSAIPQYFREPIIVFLIAIGVYLIVEFGNMNVANIVPLVLLYQRSVSFFGASQSAYIRIKKMQGFYDSLLNEIHVAESCKEIWNGKKEVEFHKDIKFHKVSFSYNNIFVHKKISFTVQKGSFVAIIGKSGSGKTTIVDLITGLLTPDSGEILVDNVSLNAVDVLKWRSVIGYVPQESILFYDTIENNITLGDRSIDKETINRAVINSGVMDFISKMPLGIHSIVGERGLKLSGGQKQRILIARALARNPKLLILDEATASLDPKTEKEILVSMMQLCSEGMTIIAISHQQALKKISDNIIQIP